MTISRVPMYRCGFCSTGHHDDCRVATRNGSAAPTQIAFCRCDHPACEGKIDRPRCIECGNRHSQDVDPKHWSCFDQDACRARTTARLDQNPLIQNIRTIKENNMAKVQADKKEKAEKAPKTGTCIVTGKPTKGGKFLPGMDARYVSNQVAAVMDGSKSETVVLREMAGHGLSDSLQAKFKKSLGIARDKAAKAEKAKADAKA